ncbi:hypothetical protein Ae263Ps1_6384 [Pseudonocardia sp. Ae263_Ps1]|nr:hypothetical protein Ae263Ps1_6384 [Pseudonocardia sp. Ae263_Ps1]
MPSATVVVALDPHECLLSDLGDIVPWPGVDEFFLVAGEERLGDGVVEAGGASAHRSNHIVGGAEVGELPARVLRPAVAVHDHSGWWAAGEQGGGEGLDDQVGAQVVGHGVADDLTGVQVDHGGEVDPAVDRLDVGDVAAPAGVGSLGGEVTPDQVRGVDRA